MKKLFHNLNGHKISIGLLFTIGLSWGTLTMRVNAVEQCAQDLKGTPVKIARIEESVKSISNDIDELKQDQKEMLRYMGEILKERRSR